jgi:hypothetical protein
MWAWARSCSFFFLVELVPPLVAAPVAAPEALCWPASSNSKIVRPSYSYLPFRRMRSPAARNVIEPKRTRSHWMASAYRSASSRHSVE